MKRLKYYLVTALIIVLCAALFAGCASNGASTGDDAKASQPSGDAGDEVHQGAAAPDTQGISDSLSDWALGTGYGIDDARLDTADGRVILTISQAAYDKLSAIDRQDILASINDLLSHYDADPAFYSVLFETGSGMIALDGETTGSDTPKNTANAQPSDTVPAADGDVTNLIFIHHSCGENWLNDGLNAALNVQGYHVADTYYGWREYGDNTDTTDWPMWFTDDVMNLVYNETGTMTASNNISPNVGENEIVMFKSCYPCSDVGSDISDEQAIYNSLLPYFAAHPSKMFILITPPPMMRISRPDKTRELTNWLVDRETGWLSNLSTGNVFVFDFYNVLTHPDAHHYAMDGRELYVVVDDANTLYYDSDSDDHPNTDINMEIEVAETFITDIDGDGYDENIVVGDLDV